MIKSIKYKAVNWVDGMKISQMHLDAYTNFTLDQLRDVSSLFINPFNYGLLPLGDKNQEQVIFDVSTTLTGDVQLTIKNCSAITLAGFRIDLSDFTTNLKALIPPVKGELEEPALTYYLIISVNPFDKVPHGAIDFEETPPRQPYTKPSYHIELMPVLSLDAGMSTSGGNFILLGKVQMQGGNILLDVNFIPPCTSLFSHPRLQNCYHSMAKTMDILQKYAIKIVQKNINYSQNAKLASNIKLLCQALIHHIGTIYFHFRNSIPYIAPIYFVACFSQLAIQVYLVTQTMSPADLEEMLNYIGEWSEIAPYVFLNQLSAVAELKYQHTTCGAHLDEIQVLMGSLEKIFLKLSELDYIGQRQENIIVNEQEVTPISKANRGWSVLD
ncbi:hypothetical protein [Myroides odoratus]|uniref:hypothetical protein n=1 Tax=Myroides odoratus TaxID=256 RepID=UPI0039AEEBAE